MRRQMDISVLQVKKHGTATSQVRYLVRHEHHVHHEHDVHHVHHEHDVHHVHHEHHGHHVHHVHVKCVYILYTIFYI